VTAVIDSLGAYRATLSSPSAGLEAPRSLHLLPLFALVLLKHPAFRYGAGHQQVYTPHTHTTDMLPLGAWKGRVASKKHMVRTRPHQL